MMSFIGRAVVSNRTGSCFSLVKFFPALSHLQVLYFWTFSFLSSGSANLCAQTLLCNFYLPDRQPAFPKIPYAWAYIRFPHFIFGREILLLSVDRCKNLVSPDGAAKHAAIDILRHGIASLAVSEVCPGCPRSRKRPT